MKSMYVSKKELKFVSLVLLATQLNCSPVSAVDKEGQDVQTLASVNQHVIIPQQATILQQEGPLMMMEPKFVFKMLVNTVPFRYQDDTAEKTSRLLPFRLVCKKWAQMVNVKRKLAYYIPLSPQPNPHSSIVVDPKKHLPPYSKGVPSALCISNYQDSNIEELHSSLALLHKLKGYPVEIIQWDANNSMKRPAVPYPISADNLNDIFKVMADSLDPKTLKTFNFKCFSLKENSISFVELLTKFPKLEHLNLNNVQVTPKDMKNIIGALPQSLVSLDLTSTNSGVEGFEALIEKLPQLKNLKLLGIHTGGDPEGYDCKAQLFYNFQFTSYGRGPRKSYNPIYSYKGGDESRRQIVERYKTVDSELMNSFKVTVAPLKELEYIVLN